MVEHRLTTPQAVIVISESDHKVYLHEILPIHLVCIVNNLVVRWILDSSHQSAVLLLILYTVGLTFVSSGTLLTELENNLEEKA